MDMQQRVAARRAELERQQRDRTAADRAASEAVAAVREARRKVEVDDVLDEVIGDAAAAGIVVRQEGENLVLAEEPAPLPAIDRAAMRRSKIDRMLDDAARRRWTPGENWVAIGLIGAGIGSIFIPVLGIPLVIAGIWRFRVTSAKYRQQIRDEYRAMLTAAAERTQQPSLNEGGPSTPL